MSIIIIFNGYYCALINTNWRKFKSAYTHMYLKFFPTQQFALTPITSASYYSGQNFLLYSIEAKNLNSRYYRTFAKIIINQRFTTSNTSVAFTFRWKKIAFFSQKIAYTLCSYNHGRFATDLTPTSGWFDEYRKVEIIYYPETNKMKKSKQKRTEKLWNTLYIFEVRFG